MAKNFNATLLRGLTYVQLVHNPKEPKFPTTYTFLKDVPVVVSAALKAVLDEYAVDEVTVSSGTEREVDIRPKFKFEDIAETETPAPVRRTAAVA